MEMGFADSRVTGDSRLSDAFGLADGLRPLTWHDLCARLAAMQELRRAVNNTAVQSGAPTGASFHGVAARLLAAAPERRAVQERENGINPSPSTNGKAEGGTSSMQQVSPSMPVEPRDRRELP